MSKAKLYKDIPQGMRQILILGGDDASRGGEAHSTEVPDICALVLDWIQQGNIPQRSEISQYINSIKKRADFIEIEELPPQKFSVSDLSSQKDEVDLMSYLFSGLAGGSSSETERKTLGGLLNYAFPQAADGNEKGAVLTAGGELRYRLIRIHHEKVNKAIVNDLIEIYDLMKGGNVKRNITRALEMIDRLQFLARDSIIAFLKNDISDVLRTHYYGKIDSWFSTEVDEITRRVAYRRGKGYQEEYSYIEELQTIIDEKSFNLEKYLDFQDLWDLKRDDKALYSFFGEICVVVKNLEHQTGPNRANVIKQLDTLVINYVNTGSARSKKSNSEVVVNKAAQLGSGRKLWSNYE